MSTERYYLTAREAATVLDVTRATLYAYASRGQLRSEPIPGQPRQRRYRREDIERLRERKAARRDPAVAAARGLHWGGPVLESGITLIHDGGLYYRGRDAVTLAESATVEQVAALLWEVEDTERGQLFEQPCALSPRDLSRLRTAAVDPLTLCQAALPIAAQVDLASYDLRSAAVRQTGARILRLLTSIVTRRTSHEPVHQALQAAWAPRTKAIGTVIRTALVLCADHELNVSAFTARCAASAGATPYDVVSAAMATLKGYRHGGAAERVVALLAASETPRSARTAVANSLRREGGVPGFGHPLYPEGDPRARLLIRIARGAGNLGQKRRMRNLMSAGTTLLREHPNLDFGLAAVTRIYALPDSAPLVLFALGRTIGWLAHAIEEYDSGELIRPRARYTGPAPQGSVRSVIN